MISVARAKERNTLSQNTTKHKRRTNTAREKENNRDLDRRRSRSMLRTIAIAPIAISDRGRDHNLADRDHADRDRDLAFVCPDLMIFFWVLFVF